MLKSDKQGFLIGELLDGQNEMLEYQQTGLNIWRNIRTDVRNIARVLGARSVNAKAAAPNGRGAARTSAAASSPSVSRSRSAGAQARDALGRFVSTARAAAPRRGTRAERQQADVAGKARTQVVATAASAAAKAAAAGERDGRGRFTGNGNGGGGRDGDTGGSEGFGAKLAERLGGIKTAIEGVTNGSEQVDPALAAAHEVKDAVAPVGRGLFALFGRSQDRKKEAWYKRILKALTGRRGDPQSVGAAPSEEGGGILGGAMAGLVARALPVIIVAVMATVVSAIGLLIGTKIGTAIYDWLDKSGIATKVFDAFDAAKDWIKSKVGAAKDAVNAAATNYSTARDIARSGGLDASGRRIDDPRRLDAPSGVSGTVGKLVGSVQRGVDYASNGGRSGAENRALITGQNYRSGNIAGLDDAHTRALVASTAATESGGGNLGVVNSAGYMGRYQAGAGWLADAGMIKGGSSAVKAAMKADGFSKEYDWGKAGGMTKFLQNDANWNGGMNYSTYLRSADAQDGAFKKNSDKAYGDLVRTGAITPGMPQEQIGGLLKARHIAGLGGAQAVAAGGTGATDANGTSARKYFDDVARDRGGFLAAYSGSAATAGAQRAPAVSVPSPVPEKIPAAEAVATPPPAVQEKDKTVRAVVREPIGQDVGDRKIAHIVSGGIGG